MCGPGGGASDDGVIVGAGDGDGDGLGVRAALVIEDLDGEGVGDLLSVGEVLDDGTWTVKVSVTDSPAARFWTTEAVPSVPLLRV